MYVHDVISKRKTCIDNKVFVRVDSMILTFHGKGLFGILDYFSQMGKCELLVLFRSRLF